MNLDKKPSEIAYKREEPQVFWKAHPQVRKNCKHGQKSLKMVATYCYCRVALQISLRPQKHHKNTIKFMIMHSVESQALQ